MERATANAAATECTAGDVVVYLFLSFLSQGRSLDPPISVETG